MPTAHLRGKRAQISEFKRWLITLYLVLTTKTHSLSVFSCVLSLNPCDVVLELTVVGKGLDTNTIALDLSFLLETVEIGHNVVCETVLSGEENNLTTSELETSSVKGFLGVFDKCGFGTDGDENLVNVDTGGLDVWLTEGLTHTLLESIGTSA
jgi:hypothetical protein